MLSKRAIAKLKGMFSRLGIPTKIMSDNGECYAGKEFQTFCDSNDIQHLTSSPRYPQSNGPAEKCIRIVEQTT